MLYVVCNYPATILGRIGRQSGADKAKARRSGLSYSSGDVGDYEGPYHASSQEQGEVNSDQKGGMVSSSFRHGIQLQV